LGTNGHGEGVMSRLTVAQNGSLAGALGGPTQSAGVASVPAIRSSVPLMAPPGECH
jgi:hypothetical protein